MTKDQLIAFIKTQQSRTLKDGNYHSEEFIDHTSTGRRFELIGDFTEET